MNKDQINTQKDEYENSKPVDTQIDEFSEQIQVKIKKMVDEKKKVKK